MKQAGITQKQFEEKVFPILEKVFGKPEAQEAYDFVLTTWVFDRWMAGDSLIIMKDIAKIIYFGCQVDVEKSLCYSANQKISLIEQLLSNKVWLGDHMSIFLIQVLRVGLDFVEAAFSLPSDITGPERLNHRLWIAAGEPTANSNYCYTGCNWCP